MNSPWPRDSPMTVLYHFVIGNWQGLNRTDRMKQYDIISTPDSQRLSHTFNRVINAFIQIIGLIKPNHLQSSNSLLSSQPLHLSFKMKFSLTNWLLVTALNINHVSANNTLRGSGHQQLQNTHHRILEEEAVGTFVVAEIEYPNEPSNGKPEQTFNIELGNGLIYTITNANPSWVNGNRKSLESGVSQIKIGAGATIVGEKLDLHGKAPEEVKNLFGRNLADDNHRELRTGTRSVLAIRVIANDGEYGFNEAFLSDSVFGTSGDPVNLVSQYKACS
jgi:hypothetical protein